MQKEELIPARDFCSYYKVEYSFIRDLEKFGLIEITSVEADPYIQQDQLQKLEQMVRLYYDLNINFEGIDAIAHLVDRVKMMQSEITGLKNRLKLYEEFD